MLQALLAVEVPYSTLQGRAVQLYSKVRYKIYMKKTLMYLLRYVNVLKKTMRKTLITYLNPTYLWYFSPPPIFWPTFDWSLQRDICLRPSHFSFDHETNLRTNKMLISKVLYFFPEFKIQQKSLQFLWGRWKKVGVRAVHTSYLT